jgi:adenosylcobinamide kinase/adenosylcobinamide-phosphate guanylyltransferase
MRTLILGGARSGKSRLAEKLALESSLQVCYFATAQAHDEEMAARIAAHQARRPGDWQTVEEPLALGDALRAHAAAERCLVVDCLTLWLTNLLLHADGEVFARERAGLLAALPELAGQVILVGNETGMGIVPMGELTRRFCDEAGWLHQELAARCETVLLTVAGLPLTLKGK